MSAREKAKARQARVEALVFSTIKYLSSVAYFYDSMIQGAVEYSTHYYPGQTFDKEEIAEAVVKIREFFENEQKSK